MAHLIFLIILLTSNVVLAQEQMLYYDGRPLEVKVSIGKVTEVIFPKKIAKIIKGGQVDGILVEVMDQSVFLLPKNENPPDIFVTNIDGENYPLHLIIDQKEYQTKLRIAYAFGEEARKKGRDGALDLMKVMLQDRIPARATVRETKETMQIAQGAIELELHTIFELPRMKGLLFTAMNVTDNRVVIPLQSLSYPGLLALCSESDTLSSKDSPGSMTKVFMVVRQ